MVLHVCGADFPDDFFLLNTAARRGQLTTATVFEGALQSHNGSLIQYQIPEASLCSPVYEGILTCDDGNSIPYIIPAFEVSRPQSSIPPQIFYESTIVGTCVEEPFGQAPAPRQAENNGVEAAIYRLSGQYLPRFAGCPCTEHLNSLHAEIGQVTACGGRLLTKSDMGDLSFLVDNFERPQSAFENRPRTSIPAGNPFNLPVVSIGAPPQMLPGGNVKPGRLLPPSLPIPSVDSSFVRWHAPSTSNQLGGSFPYLGGLPTSNHDEGYPRVAPVPNEMDHMAPYIMQGVASLGLKQDNEMENNDTLANDLVLFEHAFEDLIQSDYDFVTPPQQARASRKRKLVEMRSRQGNAHYIVWF